MSGSAGSLCVLMYREFFVREIPHDTRPNVLVPRCEYEGERKRRRNASDMVGSNQVRKRREDLVVCLHLVESRN